LAEEYLRNRKYEILHRNFQKKYGEIDLVCRKGKKFHFVEVKTRTLWSVRKFGLPEDAVTKAKQRKIIETALAFLAENGSGENTDWQIDVISIVYSSKERTAKINLIENAFGEN